MVTDFSDEDKASGVKCCTVVQGRPGQGISHLRTLLPQKPKIGRIGAAASSSTAIDAMQSPPPTASAPSVEGTIIASIANTCPRHVWIFGRPRRRTAYLLYRLATFITHKT